MRKSRLAGALCAMMMAAGPALAVPGPVPQQQQEAAPPVDPVAELNQIVGHLRAEMFKPGEVIAGWNVGGADPDAAMRAAGPEKHVFLIAQGESRQVGILSDRRIDDFAPAGWKLIDSYGSPVAYAENAFVQFAPLDAHHMVGMRGAAYRENGIDCVKAITHAVLYEKPGAPAPKADDPPPTVMFRLIMLAAEGQVSCSRYDAAPGGGWGVRHLLPDGRALPDDGPTLMTIVPAAPVEALVKPGS